MRGRLGVFVLVEDVFFCFIEEDAQDGFLVLSLSLFFDIMIAV